MEPNPGSENQQRPVSEENVKEEEKTVKLLRTGGTWPGNESTETLRKDRKRGILE